MGTRPSAAASVIPQNLSPFMRLQPIQAARTKGIAAGCERVLELVCRKEAEDSRPLCASGKRTTLNSGSWILGMSIMLSTGATLVRENPMCLHPQDVTIQLRC